MPTACLPLFTPIASILPKKLSFNASASTSRNKYNSAACKCKAALNIDLDLYDLLGIDSSSDQSQIKTAYRRLQKRCHPDIAGPAGHDMAIILNEAYSVLSDPNSRLAYDKEHAKIAELRGYTGKPLYSVWYGSESEERAVFVDEVKCIGCLKCALLAQNTFAIESVYGRARVVGQWADPEHKIQEAIQACPVDCISTVERSDLAALEYLMSKQPRGNVRVGAGNSAGTRVSNIFIDMKKFQTKFADAKNKSASKERDIINWEAKMSAIQAIRSISNWLYWQSPVSESHQNLTHITQKSKSKSKEPDIKKLREAATARKQATINRRISSNSNDEYWIPSTHALPASTNASASEPPHDTEWKTKTNSKDYNIRKENKRHPIAWGIPVVTAAIAAAIVRVQVGQGVAGGIKEHVGGSLALEIINSSWLQVTLAGITWYFIGASIVELIEAIGNKDD